MSPDQKRGKKGSVVRLDPHGKGSLHLPPPTQLPNKAGLRSSPEQGTQMSDRSLKNIRAGRKPGELLTRRFSDRASQGTSP